MMTATIWRTCPSCGTRFEQPDDPGRKRVYCSRACQQAAYRARQQHQRRTGAGHAGQAGPTGAAGSAGGGQRTRRQQAGADQQRSGARERRSGADQRHQRRPRAGSSAGSGAGSGTGRASGYRPGAGNAGNAGTGANGHRSDSAEQARIRRIIDALLRKAASTTFPHEADACRAKAEQLRIKHGL